jgi:PAS domain S-box-containing protein
MTRNPKDSAQPAAPQDAAVAQAYLAAIVDSADDAILSKDIDGIIRSCNRAAERLFGYTAAELIGRPVRILIPADRQAEEDHILARIRGGERVDHFETKRITKDGQLIDISLTVSPVRDSTGTIIGASKIARDITAQLRAATELAAQQAWFRVTLASIGDAVIAADAGGRVSYMNATAERLTGWRLASAQGRPLGDVFQIVSEKTREPVENPAELVMRVGEIVGLANHTLLISRDGAEYPITDSAAPIRDAEGRMLGVVLVFRDVMEERRAEGAIAEQRERLLEAERIARAEAERASRVKDEFVAMVSHELRTPLNAILGWTQLTLKARHDPAAVERGLEVIVRNTRVQAQLISDLLDISRIVSGKIALQIQLVSLPSIVGEAIETVQQEAAAKSIALRTELDDAVGVVAGDPARLQQVVWNLVSNAVKFTPSGGHVVVKLRGMDGHAQIIVADDGVGMRPEFLPHVFDRFHQADRSITRRFGGLGLGLSIVKHLVELHGGAVRAESAGEGKGSTFVITLPTAVAPAGAHAGEPELPERIATEAIALQGLRILLVEDDPDTREFVTRLLDGHGALVVSTASAGEALDAFRRARPQILLSDIGLPDMDGYQLIQRIRQQDPSAGGTIPAIALTAYARSDDRTRALRAGYQAHVVKPVEAAELLATIESFAEFLRGANR